MAGNQGWQKKDITGARFGRLTVIEPAGRAQNRKLIWRCKCDCGGERLTEGSDLRRGRTLSCGCLQSERTVTAHTKHGHASRDGHSPEYGIWGAMRGRCHDPNDSGFKWYGARGITVCPEWRDSFEAFFSDMGARPSPAHSIERKNNDLGYSKANCMWATRAQQARNKRGVKCVIRDDGKQYLTIQDAATDNNISASSISCACRGKQHTAAGRTWRFASDGETALLRALQSKPTSLVDAGGANV